MKSNLIPISWINKIKDGMKAFYFSEGEGVINYDEHSSSEVSAIKNYIQYKEVRTGV